MCASWGELPPVKERAQAVPQRPSPARSLTGVFFPDAAARLDALTDAATTDELLVGAMVAAMAATEKALRR